MKPVILALLAVVVAGGVALARPGGGHSFSSHSSSSHSSSHSSSSHSSSSHSSSSNYGNSPSTGGDIDPLPFIAVLSLGMVGFLLWLVIHSIRARDHVTSADLWADSYSPDNNYQSPPEHADLAPLVAADPDFSLAVFEDFAYQLYAAAHLARANVSRLAALAPYLSPSAVSWLSSRPADPPTAVVVAALSTEQAKVTGDHLRLTVKLQSNLASAGNTYYSVEHWTFIRDAAVRTKAPTRTRTWPCPNCGAPWSATNTDPMTCAYCNQQVAHGKFDWQVEAIHQTKLDSLGPTLTGTVAEEGTDAPTIVDPAARDTWNKLHTDDPNVTWEAFAQRVTLVYNRMNLAWNARDITLAGGLVTSSMLAYLRYWNDEYMRQKLHNHLDDAALSNIELAKVRRDTFYDAITVRVSADGLDYTVDDAGVVVGGSKSQRRAYTEYWTFLRSSTRCGPIVAQPVCANCGAPLADIADSGECGTCHAVIDNGSFDFVLSKIEQDEVYEG